MGSPGRPAAWTRRTIVLDLLDRASGGRGRPTARSCSLGHSFGGHYRAGRRGAASVAGRGPRALCPVVPGGRLDLPAPRVVRDDGVVRRARRRPASGSSTGTSSCAPPRRVERFRRAVVPCDGRRRRARRSAARSRWVRTPSIPTPCVVDAPVLILAGRRDRWVGWRQQERLGDRYPRATVVTVADAGHALPHEKPGLVSALLADWLDRIGDLTGARSDARRRDVQMRRSTSSGDAARFRSVPRRIFLVSRA